MRNHSLPSWTLLGGGVASLALLCSQPFLVPTDLQLPGTQPLQVGTLQAASTCDNCHGGFDLVSEPARPWRGSMMSQAGRDPLFWATMAVAEQDFPQSGDLCLRCHAPRGWIEGRSTPTDGSGLAAGDADGVECAICHQLTNPDDSEHLGVQVAPYVANDGAAPPEGYYGSGMMVLAGGSTRYGPYAQTSSMHTSVASRFHRDPKICGTCHDVSNPAVGDLAHNHGAPLPLPPGTYSGIPNAPVATKAAFNNPPYRYGVTERTFSEHQASALASLRVRDYPTLPPELQRGILERARDQALLAGRQGDYADGTTRYFSCQACHMIPVVGKGARQNFVAVRPDLPTHDLTGGNTWVPQLIRWADSQNVLRLGGGLDAVQLAALDAGVLRARANLRLAAALDVHGDVLHVVNLTGHKLISGYPEGRRMWLRIRWRDRQGNVVRVDGDYGPLAAQVRGVPATVETLLDPHDPNLRLYEADHGITQQWAQQLLGLGWSPNLPVDYDRVTGAVTLTLGQIAAQPAGTASHSFHFVLNNTLLRDTRIPPYGMDYDVALQRNILPVPATAYGNPGPAGTYRHWDEVQLQPPAGAPRAEIELLYQTTSWEYVQFLLLQNNQLSPFLGSAGQDLYDGWRATGMSPPEVMNTARWCDLPGTAEDFELRSGIGGAPLDLECAKQVDAGQTIHMELTSPTGTMTGQLVAFAFEFYADSGAMPNPTLPGLQLDRVDGHLLVPGLPGNGATMSVTIPAGFGGLVLRCQGIAISTLAQNGSYAASAAHDFILR